jgi:hypothetical protein
MRRKIPYSLFIRHHSSVYSGGLSGWSRIRLRRRRRKRRRHLLKNRWSALWSIRSERRPHQRHRWPFKIRNLVSIRWLQRAPMMEGRPLCLSLLVPFSGQTLVSQKKNSIGRSISSAKSGVNLTAPVETDPDGRGKKPQVKDSTNSESHRN